MKINPVEQKFKKQITNREIFQENLSDMGTSIALNVLIMHCSHPKDYAKYIKVIDKQTGEQVTIEFEY